MQKIKFLEYPEESLSVFKPILVKDDFFFTFFGENEGGLRFDDQMKPIQLNMKETVYDDFIVTNQPLTPHSCFRYIYIKNNESIFSSRFDYFNLVKSMSTDKVRLNINYDHNQSLNIVQWDVLINSSIKEIEKSSRFELVRDK